MDQEATQSSAAVTSSPQVGMKDPSRPGDMALLVRWSMQSKVPAWLNDAFLRWEEERQYIHTIMLAEDDPNRVAVPFLYRALIAKLSLLRPDKPEPVVKRLPMVDPLPGDPRAPIWQQFCQTAEAAAKTAGFVLRGWAREEHLESITQRMLLDGLSVGIAWIKTGFREDAGRDLLGRHVRHQGARPKLVRLQRLSREFAAGEWGEDDGRYAELVALSDYAREESKQVYASGDPRSVALQGTMAGTPAPPWMIPDPQTWRGGQVGIVDPENLRFDWLRVTSPETVHLGRWWQERVWMSIDEVKERFALTDDEAKAIGSPWNSAAQQLTASTGAGSAVAVANQNPADVVLEANVRDGGREVAVWERHDMELGMVAWWVQGIPRILDRQYLDAQTKRGHPYQCFVPNPVSGRFLGLSDTQLAKKEQDALNQALTDDFEARVAAYPFYAAIAGLLSEEDKRVISTRKPNAVVELSQRVGDIKENLQKFPGEPYDSNLYLPAAQQAQRNIELALGLPTEAMQGINRGTKFATQTAVAQDNMTAQMGRISAQITEIQRQVFDDWLDYALACYAPEEAQRYAGPFGLWPLFDRDHIARALTVEVVTTSSRANRSGDIEDMGQALQVIQGLLQARMLALQQGLKIPADEIAQKIAAALDLRLSGQLLDKIDPQMMAAAAGGVPAPAGAPVPQPPMG